METSIVIAEPPLIVRGLRVEPLTAPPTGKVALAAVLARHERVVGASTVRISISSKAKIDLGSTRECTHFALRLRLPRTGTDGARITPWVANGTLLKASVALSAPAKMPRSQPLAIDLLVRFNDKADSFQDAEIIGGFNIVPLATVLNPGVRFAGWASILQGRAEDAYTGETTLEATMDPAATAATWVDDPPAMAMLKEFMASNHGPCLAKASAVVEVNARRLLTEWPSTIAGTAQVRSIELNGMNFPMESLALVQPDAPTDPLYLSKLVATMLQSNCWNATDFIEAACGRGGKDAQLDALRIIVDATTLESRTCVHYETDCVTDSRRMTVATEDLNTGSADGDCDDSGSFAARLFRAFQTLGDDDVARDPILKAVRDLTRCYLITVGVAATNAGAASVADASEGSSGSSGGGSSAAQFGGHMPCIGISTHWLRANGYAREFPCIEPASPCDNALLPVIISCEGTGRMWFTLADPALHYSTTCCNDPVLSATDNTHSRALACLARSPGDVAAEVVHTRYLKPGQPQTLDAAVHAIDTASCLDSRFMAVLISVIPMPWRVAPGPRALKYVLTPNPSTRTIGVAVKDAVRGRFALLPVTTIDRDVIDGMEMLVNTLYWTPPLRAWDAEGCPMAPQTMFVEAPLVPHFDARTTPRRVAWVAIDDRCLVKDAQKRFEAIEADGKMYHRIHSTRGRLMHVFSHLV